MNQQMEEFAKKMIARNCLGNLTEEQLKAIVLGAGHSPDICWSKTDTIHYIMGVLDGTIC